MQQAQDFYAESEALHELVSKLSDDALVEKTAFKDWTINAVIGHLHMWNWAADLALGDTDAFKAFLAGLQIPWRYAHRVRERVARWCLRPGAGENLARILSADDGSICRSGSIDAGGMGRARYERTFIDHRPAHGNVGARAGGLRPPWRSAMQRGSYP